MNEKWSHYSFLVQSNKFNCYFLYNTMSNALLKLDNDDYSTLLKVKNGDIPLKDLDNETNELLLKNKFIVDDDDVEFLKFKFIKQSNRFDKTKMTLTIAPTIQCDLACSYCFEKEHSNIFMNENTENDIIDFIKRHEGVKSLHITWYGGEPLLAYDSIKSLTKKIKLLKLDRYTSDIVTNGINFNKNIINELEDLSINRVHITIDGLEDAHNKRRPLKNGGNSFQTILRNLDLLFKKDNIFKTIRVNTDNTNFEEFHRLHEFLQNRYKGKMINIYVGFVKNTYGACASTDEITMSYQKQADFILELNKKHNIFSPYYLSPNRYNYECIARQVNGYLLDAEGYIYKCWTDVGDRKESVGHINRYNEQDLDQNIKYLVGEDPLDDPKCKKCAYLPICGGGCPHLRLKNKYEKNKTNVCHLIKNNLISFIEEYYEKQII